jgi:hypothetical protein
MSPAGGPGKSVRRRVYIWKRLCPTRGLYNGKDKMDNSEINALVAEKVTRLITGPIVEIIGGKAVNAAGDSVILPDYTEEIDRAWQVETKIDQTPDLFNEYISALTDILQIPKTGQGFSKGEVWAFLRATPKQRCLAALKAVGVEVSQSPGTASTTVQQ